MIMKRAVYLLVLPLMMAVGCSDEGPVAIDAGDSSPALIPEFPKTAPCEAHEENTIVCVEPTADCMPGPDGLAYFEFPGVVEGDHIGTGTISGGSVVNFFVFPFQQSGQSTITAANGDQLVFNYAGTAVPGAGEGDVIFGGWFTFVGGTGRFATASGMGTYAGTANTIAGVGQYDMDGVISR
jgi:hypothetical protein